MIVIRRLVDSRRAYTGIFLPGEEARIFPTSDDEHNRILQVFRQDKPYAGILNDFTEFALGSDQPLGAPRDGSLQTETSALIPPSIAPHPHAPFPPMPLALPAPQVDLV